MQQCFAWMKSPNMGQGVEQHVIPASVFKLPILMRVLIKFKASR